MWGPIVVSAWIAALVGVVYLWARFAGRRNRLAKLILDDRQRRINNELDDLTLHAIRLEDARADVYAIWAEHDREAGR